MARKKPAPKPTGPLPLPAWSPAMKASRACIRHFIIKALKWQGQIECLPMWRKQSCDYLIEKAEHDAAKSLKTLARENLNYARVRALLGVRFPGPDASVGYPWDRPAYEAWQKLNPDCPLGKL